MTFTIEESVTIERPVQEVFAFLDDDVERFASWRRPPWMELRRLTDGPVGAGTRYATSLRMLGIPQGPIVTEVTPCHPPHHLEWRPITPTTLPAEAGGEYRLEEVDGSTRVTITGRVGFPRWIRDFEPVGRAIFGTRYLRPMMRRIKEAAQRHEP